MKFFYIYYLRKKEEKIINNKNIIKNKRKNKKDLNWIGINKILNNGIIELYSGEYIKILKISPINFYSKTKLEQQSILQNYKTFLKTCNFNIQILIQNKKENISKNIQIINEKISEEKNEKINLIRKKYIEIINKNNLNSETTSKNYFLIIKKENVEIKDEEIITEELNDKYLKIKEVLNRCGNEVREIDYDEMKEIIFSFFNTRKFLNQGENNARK